MRGSRQTGVTGSARRRAIALAALVSTGTVCAVLIAGALRGAGDENAASAAPGAGATMGATAWSDSIPELWTPLFALSGARGDVRSDASRRDGRAGSGRAGRGRDATVRSPTSLAATEVDSGRRRSSTAPRRRASRRGEPRGRRAPAEGRERRTRVRAEPVRPPPRGGGGVRQLPTGPAEPAPPPQPAPPPAPPAESSPSPAPPESGRGEGPGKPDNPSKPDTRGGGPDGRDDDDDDDD